MDAPAIVQSPDGSRIAAAWMDNRNGAPRPCVWLALAAGGKFAKEAAISDQADDTQGHPTLAWDAKGQALWAVWEDGRKGAKAIRGCMVSKSRKEWAVSDDADGACSFPVVASGGGLSVVAYEAKDASDVRLRTLSDAK